MTIQTSIQKAKDWEPGSDVPMTPTDTIRSRFFRGQGLNADEIADELGCSNALLGHAVQTLRMLGYDFTETNSDGKKRFFMQNKDHFPTDEQVTAQRAKNRAQKKPPAKKKQPRSDRSEVVKPVPAPAFGEFVEVYLLHANGDGKVHMGLRDEQTSWMVTIEAGAPREG